jgi:hypothetical protein
LDPSATPRNRTLCRLDEHDFFYFAENNTFLLAPIMFPKN